MTDEYTPDWEAFDQITIAETEQAIAEAGRMVAPKTIVKYPNLWVRFPSGNIYRMPLNPSQDLVDSIADETPVDQMISLLTVDDPDTRTNVRGESSASIIALSYTYTKILTQVQGASLGKSSASSD